MHRTVRLWMTVAALLGSMFVPAATANAAPTVLPFSLSDVTCPSSSRCFAVGVSASGSGSSVRTLVVRWTGNSWSIMPSPNGAASHTWLSGIACTSEVSCVAVGNTTSSGYGGQPFAMRMVGATWSTVAVPAVPAGKGALLSDVACPGPKSCFAVGEFATSAGAKPLAERWNGQKWTSVAAAVPSGRAFARLRGVGCASASKCFAVGGTDTQDTNAAIVERWNGTKWVMERQFTTPGGVSPSLDDVTCPTTTRCRAVGNDGSAFVRTLAARWTGTTWSIEATKNRDEENYLLGVACWTAADCFAVGNSTESIAGPTHTLSERRSSSGWSIVATPDKDPRYNTLAGVDCIGAKLCFAVGSSNAPTANGLYMVILRWDGTHWISIKTP